MPKSPSHADAKDELYNEVELPGSIEIRESSVAEGQPGAFSKTLIKKDTRFGPYKGEIIKPGQKSDIDYRYAWEIFEKRRNVLKFTISALDPKTSNWMRNVNCARFYEEQNIVSTQEGFSIFYIAMKDIKPGEELLTWFDPQLLKRTKRRVSRGERKRVGYTIELVPWSDEKKFVPEIIETKRTRKKKVLGDDMLSFEDDAALMQKSMNSMLRIPKKSESHTQPKREYLQSQSAFTSQHLLDFKKEKIDTSPPASATEKKSDLMSPNIIPISNIPLASSLVSTERKVSLLDMPKENRIEKEIEVVPNRIISCSSPKIRIEKADLKAMRKRKRRDRVRSNINNYVKTYMDDFVADTRKVIDSAFGLNSDNPSLLKPVVIRTKENGIIEMEDHDETYEISWPSARQECDDLCECMDKHGLLKPENDSSSSLDNGSEKLVVHFTLLPEHQTFSTNNKVIYKCDICDSLYNHAFSLKRHYLGVHINHRYLSQDDVKFCQLETFHNGLNNDFPKDTEKNVINSTYSSDLNTQNENESFSKECVSQDSKSLLCNETLLDDVRPEIPTLSSLAQIQVEKNNKSSTSQRGKENALTFSGDELDKMDNGGTSLLEKRLTTLSGKSNTIYALDTLIKTTELCETSQNCQENNVIINNDSQGQKECLNCMPATTNESGNEKEEIMSNINESNTVNTENSQDEEKPVDNSLCEKYKEAANNEEDGNMDEEKKVRKTEIESSEDKSNERIDSISFNVEPSKENEVCRKQDDDFKTCLKQGEGKGMEKEKLLKEVVSECLKVVSSSEEHKLKDNDEVVEKDKKDCPSEEISHAPANNDEKANGEPLTQTAYETGKSKIQKLSLPQPLLPIQTSIMQAATNVKSPPAQQKFLLLVPIVPPPGKLSPSSKSNPSSSSNLPQSQSSVPVVVLSSQVPSNTTNLHLQSSTLNPQLCPQVLARHGQVLPTFSASSSIAGQNFALVSNNTFAPTVITNNSIQSTASATTTTFSVLTASVPTNAISLTTRANQCVPSLAASDANAVKKPVKLEEADQPGDLYRCHMCVLVYKTMAELKHHIKNDPHRFKGGIKQYACPKCSVRFRNKANLARHTLMHHQTSDDKDRSFRCLTCGKGFTTETYLKMHARFHLGKSFPCKYGCVDAFFPNAGSLVKHLRAIHPGLNLKEYLREKKRKEKMKGKDLSNETLECSISHSDVGFQAKRGRPKGSKNVPKELKLSNNNTSKFPLSQNGYQEERMPFTGNVASEIVSPMESYPAARKYFPIEKTWQKGNFMFQKEKFLSVENTQESPSAPRRRFNCKMCDASFLSYLYLLKHRSKRHAAGQSVQEFLFEMAKDREEESCFNSNSEVLQFSPPPSPKTFFSNVNQRGAENMSKYIEGGAEMLKCCKKLSFDDKNSDPFSTPPLLEWTHFNFPPCFKYVRDSTVFYHNARSISTSGRDTVKPKMKVENLDISKSEVENTDHLNKSQRSVSLNVGGEKNTECEKVHDLERESEDEIGLNEYNADENSDSVKEKEMNNLGCKVEEKSRTKICDKGTESFNLFNDTTPCAVKTESSYTMNQDRISKDSMLPNTGKGRELNDSSILPLSMSKPDPAVSDTPKGNAKAFKKVRAELQEIMIMLNSFSMKALDLEVGSKYINRDFGISTVSVLDSLNLFSGDGSKKQNQRFFLKRKRRERYATISVCSQLLPSRIFCKNRDQLACSIFSSPDFTKNEPRRYSIWQGPNYSKVDTKHSDKFCCPVVESVRQQNVRKKLKEIYDRNDKEEIDLKPKEKKKEEFASNIGLMSRREYDCSYHALEKTEHCIKPPEIWEIYDRIWFGKKGTITVVCSICHRHFSCLELCLRHQLKKHPHIEPSSLEMERDNYVEDMYYYYPMPYGILAQTHLIPDKLPPPEVYVCTRCRFPFKNVNKLHSHMVTCDPNNVEQVTKIQSVHIEKKLPVVMPVTDRVINESNTIIVTQPYNTKPPGQRLPTSKFKNYQLFNKSNNSLAGFRGKISTYSENKVVARSSISSLSMKSQNFINFSTSLPRRKRNQHGLLYNPSNHTRRRELYHVLDQHQCHGCNLKFKSMSMLERHVKKCSGKDKLQNQKPLLSGVSDEMMVRKQHTCRYCNKRFTFIKGVDLHYKRICSIRKIREEENQLTEEDLAHEAELQKIIEHLKWSKSLNKDSSDIIQGHVKVEDDGTLTRVEKKRGRPFGKGRRIKKKGCRWTTLKYHRQDEDNFVSSSGQSTPRIHDIPQINSSPTTTGNELNESLEPIALNQTSTSSVNESVVQKIKPEEKKNVHSGLDPTKPIPRKRGRPFKNRNGQPAISEQPKRKRGRPKKDNEAGKSQQDSVQAAKFLKDSINFKRGATPNEYFVPKKEKLSPSNIERTAESKVDKSFEMEENRFECVNQKDTKLETKTQLNINRPLKKTKNNLSAFQRKRKLEESNHVIETITKPPARVRGRPKKFDPSDMESSYKKKRKTDPGYVPFVKCTSTENLSDELFTNFEAKDKSLESKSDGSPDKNSLTKNNDALINSIDECNSEVEKLKENGKKTEKKKELNEQKLKIIPISPIQSVTSQSKTVLENSPDQVAMEVVEDKLNACTRRASPEKKSGDDLVCETKNSNSQKNETRLDHKLDAKKRKMSSSLEGTDAKRSKYTTKEPQESNKETTVKKTTVLEKSDPRLQSSVNTSIKDGQPKEKITPVLQDQCITATMSSASPKGDVVQTPVAVRIVTLPLSSLSTSMPSKTISPSSSLTSVQQLNSTTNVVSSPLLKLTFTQSPQLSLTSKTHQASAGAISTTILNTMTTASNEAAAGAPNTKIQNTAQDNKPIVQQPPTAIPMAQVIPIANKNLLIPPQAIQSGITPRFIIHSSPRGAVVTTSQRPKVPATVATTLTRHVSPSAVILSTGKVVSIGGTVLSGSNVVQNPVIQQGKHVMKKINVINPINNSSTPPQQFSPIPPRPVIRKGTGIVIEPPTQSLIRSSPPAKPLYYVQTSPLPNQVVMPISSIKPDMNTKSNENQVLLNLKDGKTKVMDRIAVPQLQFIPVSLVQGAGQNLIPTQINTQSEPNHIDSTADDKAKDIKGVQNDKS